MIVTLQRPPLTSNSTQWERLAVDPGNLEADLLRHARAFAEYHNNHTQVVILDVTNGVMDARLIAVYWSNDRRLQLF